MSGSEPRRPRLDLRMELIRSWCDIGTLNHLIGNICRPLLRLSTKFFLFSLFWNFEIIEMDHLTRKQDFVDQKISVPDYYKYRN